MLQPRHLAALLLGATATWAQAATAVIDFGSQGRPLLCAETLEGTGALRNCDNYDEIHQSYGDIAGVLDVSYSAPRLGTGQSLTWWSTSYNTLYGVAWAEGSDTDSLARIDLQSLNGQAITLSSFDLGAYSETTRATTVRVSELGGRVLYNFTGNVGDGRNGPTSFTFVGLSSTTGLRIEWRDSAYNVGIDNIRLQVSAVPEPASAALLALGGLALGLRAARRRGNAA